jgi:hypothetical protein
MWIQNFPELVERLPADVGELATLVRSELDGTCVKASSRRVKLEKVRDQWRGAPKATAEKYHPDQYGLTADQQAHFRKILERSHVNLVEPALDRLVNSIHAGRIQRRVNSELPVLAELARSRDHGRAMSRLCENAFAYGTGILVPLAGEDGSMGYWLPDPLRTVLVVSPDDVMDVLGIMEVSSRWNRKPVLRYVTKARRGVVDLETRLSEDREEEHGLGWLPAVMAYGRDRRHEGEPYGGSLVHGVAEAAIRVTNNEVNLELLRDRQTQALLVVQGEPVRTSADDQGAQGKYAQFPRDGGDARYETPESRIEAVIELTKRFCADAAVSSGLPLDTFLPELIAGSDASATAARIRAFPLQQRMVRLVEDWTAVEEEALVVLAAVAMAETGELAGENREELRRLVMPVVSISPSLPEAEAETLSNWQQKTTNFMARIEEAIDFYSPSATDEERGNLARAWRIKNDPTYGMTPIEQYHVENGLLTVNEVRLRIGLPEVPWGDVSVVDLKGIAEARAQDVAARRDAGADEVNGGEMPPNSNDGGASG